MTLFLLVVAIVIFLAIGFHHSRHIATSDDYNVAGRRMGAWMVGASIVATYMSTSTYLGFSGLIYSEGFGVFAIALAAGFALVVAGLLIIGPLRRLRAVTIPEFVGRRYDSRVARGVSALLVFCITLGIGGATTIGFSLILEQLTGMPYNLAIVIAIGTAVIYVAMGGLLSIFWTDALSLVGMLLLVAVGLPYLFGSEAGFGEVFRNLEAQNWTSWNGANGTISGSLLTGQVVLWTFGGAVLPYVFSRGFSARSRSDAVQGFALGFPLYTLVAIVPIILVMGATRHLLPGIEDTDTAFIQMAQELLPGAVGSLMLFVVLLAGLSSIDSMLVVASQSFSIDVYEYMLHPEADQKSRLRVSRLTVFGAALAILVIALIRPTQIFFIASYAVQLSAAGLFIPIVAGIYWKRSTAAAAIAAMIGGPLTIVITSYMDLTWMGPLGHVVVPGMIAAALLFFGISFATQGSIRERHLEVFELARTATG